MGTISTMVCVDLVVTNVNIVVDAQLEVGVAHTWIGDLIFKLVAPNGQVLTLMSRPGTAEVIDNGIGGPNNGDSSNLEADFHLTFLDAGVKDAELMGDTLASAGVVCKNDMQCSYKPNHGAGPGVDFGDFAGLPANGTWKFCVGDRLQFGTGIVDDAILTLTLM
jgi:hypothetical protein